MLGAFNSRDRARFDAAFDPDLVVVDRRPLGFGEIDLDRFRETFTAAYEISPDISWGLAQELASAPRVSLALIETRGTREGGLFVTSFLGLIEVNGSVVVRLETFAVTDQAAAEVRFAELVREAQGRGR